MASAVMGYHKNILAADTSQAPVQTLRMNTWLQARNSHQ